MGRQHKEKKRKETRPSRIREELNVIDCLFYVPHTVVQ